MRDELKISLRSVLFRKKQYISLFLVCIFGIGVSLFCLFLMNGMVKALEDKGRIYYGGDYQLLGGTGNLDIYNFNELESVLNEVFPKDSVINERYDLDASYAAFYFEGTGVRQRVIKGIHFEKETELLNSFTYVEGSVEACLGEDKNIIVLSKPIADMLEVHAGNQITFLLKNRHGQIDTRQVTVAAIFKDSSLFGMYTSYTDINFLRDINKYPANSINRICINIPGYKSSHNSDLYFQTSLEQKLRMFPLVKDKQDFYDQLWSIPMPTYALIPLSANLQDVQILIDAMTAIVLFIILILVIIIVAGVSSSYRIIVMKRINEIGIYKAIGMRRQNITIMLMLETLFILVISCILGFAFSGILCGISTLFNLSFIPAFDIFLVGGHLKPVLSLAYTLLICFSVIVTTLIAVWFSIKKSVEITPCEALSTVE